MKQILSINMAMSIDGKVQSPFGSWRGLSGPEDKRQMQFIRNQHKTLMLSGSVIRKDNPPFSKKDFQTAIIIVNKNELSFQYNIFNAGSPVFIFAPKSWLKKNKDNKQKWKRNYNLTKDKTAKHTGMKQYTSCYTLRENKNIHLCIFKKHKAKQWLKVIRKIKTGPVLLEGGSYLNYLFMKAELVSDFYLTLVPYIFGKKNLKSPAEHKHALNPFVKKPKGWPAAFHSKNLLKGSWSLESCTNKNSEVFLHYKNIKRKVRRKK